MNSSSTCFKFPSATTVNAAGHEEVSGKLFCREDDSFHLQSQWIAMTRSKSSFWKAMKWPRHDTISSVSFNLACTIMDSPTIWHARRFKEVSRKEHASAVNSTSHRLLCWRHTRKFIEMKRTHDWRTLRCPMPAKMMAKKVNCRKSLMSSTLLKFKQK